MPKVWRHSCESLESFLIFIFKHWHQCIILGVESSLLLCQPACIPFCSWSSSSSAPDRSGCFCFYCKHPKDNCINSSVEPSSVSHVGLNDLNITRKRNEVLDVAVMSCSTTVIYWMVSTEVLPGLFCRGGRAKGGKFKREISWKREIQE